MRWNPETELLFRDQFEQSEAGAGFYYSGSILLGEAWEQAADLVPHALNPRSRLIRFARKDSFYYTAFDENGRRLLRAILGRALPLPAPAVPAAGGALPGHK